MIFGENLVTRDPKPQWFRKFCLVPHSLLDGRVAWLETVEATWFLDALYCREIGSTLAPWPQTPPPPKPTR